MANPIARIILRYLSGFLVSYGLLSPDMGSEFAVDPDLINVLVIALGAIAGAATEFYYWLAKRYGWPT